MMLDAVFGPLFELNPLKYASDARYRRSCQRALGRRATRIFRYQICWVLLLIVSVTAYFMGTQ